MNNIFEEVKQRTDIIQVCDMLGLKLNRSHMCVCPFHNEKTPSFSVHPGKGIFYCFGCNEKGDSIALVSKMYNIKPLDAAKIINQNLGLGIELNNEKKTYNKYLQTNKYQEKKKIQDEFSKWENHTMKVLCDYLHLLNKWGQEESMGSELFSEFANNVDYIDYILDEIFINGSDKDKIWYWKNKRREVNEIESRIKRN